ncbi:MAG: hypothetical protein GDA49_08475 [Rhodospirillales bacterium]|nr:hypothetical protein [Rhodospirillales bacterium]
MDGMTDHQAENNGVRIHVAIMQGTTDWFITVVGENDGYIQDFETLATCGEQSNDGGVKGPFDPVAVSGTAGRYRVDGRGSAGVLLRLSCFRACHHRPDLRFTGFRPTSTIRSALTRIEVPWRHRGRSRAMMWLRLVHWPRVLRRT